MNKTIEAQFRTELALAKITLKNEKETLAAIIEAETTLIELLGYERPKPPRPPRKKEATEEQLLREAEEIHYLPSAARLVRQANGEENLGRILSIYNAVAADAFALKKETGRRASANDTSVINSIGRIGIALDGTTLEDISLILPAVRHYQKLEQRGARGSLTLFTERYAHVITNRFYSLRDTAAKEKKPEDAAKETPAQTPEIQAAAQNANPDAYAEPNPDNTPAPANTETKKTPTALTSKTPDAASPTKKDDPKKGRKPRREKTERSPDERSALAIEATAALLRRKTTEPVDEFLANWASWSIEDNVLPFVNMKIEELTSLTQILLQSTNVPDQKLAAFIEDTRDMRRPERFGTEREKATITKHRPQVLAKIAQDPEKYIGAHKYIYSAMLHSDVEKAIALVDRLDTQEKNTLTTAAELIGHEPDDMATLSEVIEKSFEESPKRKATFALIDASCKTDNSVKNSQDAKKRLSAVLPEIKKTLDLSNANYATVASRAITKFSTYGDLSSELIAALTETVKRAATPQAAKMYADLQIQITEERSSGSSSLGAINDAREATQQLIRTMETLSPEAVEAVRKTAKDYYKSNTKDRRIKHSPQPLYIDQILTATAEAAKIDPEKAREYATGLLHTNRRRIPYNLGPVFTHLPALTERLSHQQWNKLKTILITADTSYAVTKEKKAPTKIVLPFVEPIITTIAEMEPKKVPYLLRELRNMQRRITERHHSGPVSLETMVCENVAKLRKKLGKKHLTALHEMFAHLYESPTQGVIGLAKETLATIARDIRKIPREYRDAVIDGLRGLLSDAAAQDAPLSQRNTMATAYTWTLRERATSLGDNIPSWVARARSFRDLDKVINYLSDPTGYYEAETETLSSGLLLSDVQLTLLTYAQSLAGAQFSVKKRAGNTITATLEQDTIVLPETISASKDRAHNFSVYKALVSWQAGAVEFGTYALPEDAARARDLPEDATLADLLNSYANPDLARELFHILEFARIDSHLNEQYPGLVKDLKLAKKTLVGKTKNGKNGIEATLAQLNRYTFGAAAGKETQELCAHIDSVKNQTLEQTLTALDTLYRALEVPAKEQRIAPREHALEINLEEAKRRQKAYGARVAAPDSTPAVGKRFRYDEWDESTGQYRQKFTQVIETQIPIQQNGYAKRVLERDARAIAELKEWFETLPPEQREHVKKQTSGDVDMDAYIQMQAEIKKGITPSDKIYTRERKSNRSVATLLLFELSGSLRKFIDIRRPDRRLMDVVRDSAIYFSEALSAAGEPFAIAGFSGETEQNVEYYPVKAFTQEYGARVTDAIGSLVPLKQSRDGAGIRHATAQLLQTDARTKFLIYLMEGMPNDHGYTDAHALEDTKRAVIEAKTLGVTPIVFAFGSPVNSGLAALAEHAIYREVKDPNTLAATLPHIYARYAF